MWAQLIEARLKPEHVDTFPQLIAQLHAVEQPGSGLLQSLALQDQGDPCAVRFLVLFESEERAREREHDSRRQQGLAEVRSLMSDVFEGSPTFFDMTVTDFFTPKAQAL